MRETILKQIRVAGKTTAGEIIRSIKPLFPKTKNETLRSQVYRNLHRLEKDGIVECVDGVWKLKDVGECFNCRQPLNPNLLWHKCGNVEYRTFKPLSHRVVLLKWNGNWMPVAEMFSTGESQSKSHFICPYCNQPVMERNWGLVYGSVFVFLPSPCPHCGKDVLWMFPFHEIER